MHRFETGFQAYGSRLVPVRLFVVLRFGHPLGDHPICQCPRLLEAAACYDIIGQHIIDVVLFIAGVP